MDYAIHLLNYWGIFSELPNWGEARGLAIHPTLHQQNICLSWKQLREKNRKTAYTYIPIAIFNFVRNYSTLLAFANLPSPRPLTLRTKTQQYHVQHGFSWKIQKKYCSDANRYLTVLLKFEFSSEDADFYTKDIKSWHESCETVGPWKFFTGCATFARRRTGFKAGDWIPDGGRGRVTQWGTPWGDATTGERLGEGRYEKNVWGPLTAIFR